MSQTCHVDQCGRPVEDAWVCSTCAGDLEADLAELPALSNDLDLVLARLTAYGDRMMGGPGANRKIIPFDARASDVKNAMHAILVSWTRLCFEERPGINADWPADEIGHLAVFVLAQVEWLRHHEAGHEAVDEIRGAVERVRLVVDRPPDRWYAGACDQCGVDLYVRVGTFAAVCRCGSTYDVPTRRSWLLDKAEDVLCNATDMSRALSNLDQPVTADRIWKWRERGQLLEHARDRRGRPLYRVGDIRDLLARAARRARLDG